MAGLHLVFCNVISSLTHHAMYTFPGREGNGCVGKFVGSEVKLPQVHASLSAFAWMLFSLFLDIQF